MVIDATMRGVLEQYIDSIVMQFQTLYGSFLTLPRMQSYKYRMRKTLHWGSFGDIQNAF